MAGVKVALYRAARRVFPARWLRTLRRPMLVPSYYRRLIRRSEEHLDLQGESRPCDTELWAIEARRLGHILDKGLRREDREPGHSVEVAADARSVLDLLASAPGVDAPSATWANGVVQMYDALQTGADPGPLGRSDVEAGASYDDLLRTIRARRSVRSFGRQQVDEGTLGRIVEALSWAPSSCNRQPVRAFASLRPEVVAPCLRTCKGATCFGDRVPCFIAFAVDIRTYSFPQELWLPALDAGLGVENCCLAAHSLGLSLTLLSWAQSTDAEDETLRRLLSIPRHYQIVVNGVVGYPAEWPPAPGRKSLATALTITGAPE